jgi:peptidoglycan/xylan/chitin deacetylase (PgdA/CDA1 family)
MVNFKSKFKRLFLSRKMLLASIFGALACAGALIVLGWILVSSVRGLRINFQAYSSRETAPKAVTAVARQFLNQFAHGDFAAQWQELAPQAQGLWPSRQARTAMLQTKFANAAISSAALGQPISGVAWTAPEHPLITVKNTFQFPVKISFSNSASLLPKGVAGSFSMLTISVAYDPKTNQAQIVGEGPASLDAPILQPAVTPNRTANVPIFMYHLVDQIPSPLIEPGLYAWQVEVGLTTLPSQFNQEMAYAAKIKASSISLQRLDDYLLYGLPLPAHPFIVTFDDGRLSQWTNAVPILKKYGFTAVFFPCTGLIGATVGPQTYMTAAQLQALASGGFFVEDHTINDGKALWNLSPQQLDPLTYQTKLSLQDLTGDPVQFIAYTGVWPWPTADQGMAQEAGMFQTFANYGYVGGLLDLRVDSDTEISNQPWMLPRVRVGLKMKQPYFEYLVGQ